MITTSLLAVAASAMLPECLPFATLSRSPARRGGREQIQICVGRDEDRGHFTFAHTAFARDNAETRSAANSRTCAAVLPVLHRMETLAMPTPDVPGYGTDLNTLTLDGVAYRLETLATYGDRGGKLELSSNVGTPLAAWSDAMFGALESCWRQTAIIPAPRPAAR